MEPKHPQIEVKLTGTDGNAFSIMGKVTQAMRRGGCSKGDIETYLERAMSSDYDNLLRVSAETVSVR